MNADPAFKVIEDLSLDDAAVSAFKGLMELGSIELIFTHALRHDFGQNISHIDEHFLGRLECLWLHFRNKMPRKLIETQRDDECDEEEGDPCETHNDRRISKHHQIA